jgi:hypothetical protein
MRRRGIILNIALLIGAVASSCAPQSTPTVAPTATLVATATVPPVTLAPTGTVAPTATLDPTATLAPTPTIDRVAAWRADLRALAVGMQQVHPNLFWRASQAEFQALVADLDARIPELSDGEVVAGLARIVAFAPDGHSFLPLFQKAAALHLYPLRFYLFSDGLYVVAADAPYQNLVGARVTRIGRLSVEEAYAAAAPVANHDNDQTVALLVPVFIRVPEVLLERGIIGDAAKPGFVLSMPDGSERTVDPEAIGWDSYHSWLTEHRQIVGLPQQPEPLYLSRKDDENYWYTLLEDKKTLFIQYNLGTDFTQSGQNIYTFADEIDKFVAANNVKRTILDLRHNPAGDNFGPLARVLAENERINQPGRLYVLIGRETFSAAMELSMQLERTTAAIFVGEPTGSRPDTFGGQETLTLPYSGLEAFVSGVAWQTGTAPDPRLWLEPDLPVALSAADFFAARDPVLEAALAADIP